MTALSVAAAVLGGGIMAGVTQAAEIKVLGTPGVREFYVELVRQFEKETGHKVSTVWAGTVDVTRRISGGETVDLVIMAGNSLDELTRLGKILPGSRVDVAKSGIGLAVRAGAPRPDISSGEAVKQTLLAARSIAYSSGPSGVYLAGLVQRMGIAEQIKQKMKQIPPGEAVGELVARGEAEVGLHQMSELLPVKGIDIVGPLPPDVQQITVFSAGLHAGASNPDAARALVRFISAPSAAATIKRHGMEPG
jgi:molybdate transport system substrate-binding protein